jgi:hypothetical protein
MVRFTPTTEALKTRLRTRTKHFFLSRLARHGAKTRGAVGCGAGAVHTPGELMVPSGDVIEEAHGDAL